MIKYDGHMCWHQLSNHADESMIHSCDWLEFMLPMQHAITIELTILSICTFDEHIKHILSDYPNIKIIYIYNSTRLDPRYVSQDILAYFIEVFNKYDEHINFIYSDGIESLIKHKTMPISVFNSFLSTYKTFAWRPEDFEDYIDEHGPEYRALWSSLNEYHKDFTWNDFVCIVTNNLKPANQCIKNIELVLDGRKDFKDFSHRLNHD
jgi:predicted nucleic-acid-binding protein